MTLHDRLKPVLGPPRARLTAVLRGVRPRSFAYEGRERACFVHRYNETWRNERTIEIPLAVEVLRGRVLELGNVLAHYGHGGHPVVDKYEVAPGVVNVDIVDFETDERFDTVVSISTVEHVGFDEDRKDAGKPRRAVERLRSLLAPGGTLFVTFPVGYNPAVDAMAAPGAGVFDAVGYMRRSADGRTWEQVGWEAVRDSVYEANLSATAIAVCTARA